MLILQFSLGSIYLGWSVMLFSYMGKCKCEGMNGVCLWIMPLLPLLALTSSPSLPYSPLSDMRAELYLGALQPLYFSG